MCEGKSFGRFYSNRYFAIRDRKDPRYRYYERHDSDETEIQLYERRSAHDYRRVE